MCCRLKVHMRSLGAHQQGGEVRVEAAQVQQRGGDGALDARQRRGHAQHARARLRVPRPRLGGRQLQRARCSLQDT
jgi:hypothetical protein